MRLLTVRHVTIYRYSERVTFGEHRMMCRPRESHDLRLLSTKLDIVPRPSNLRWLHDVFDNSVAVATFDVSGWKLNGCVQPFSLFRAVPNRTRLRRNSTLRSLCREAP